MISEAIVNLHRPYFIHAMQEVPDDPTSSMYGQAFLSVIERSNVRLAFDTQSANPAVGDHSNVLWSIFTSPERHCAPMVDMGEYTIEICLPDQ